MGALKRSNRPASQARNLPPAEDLESGPRSGIRAKRGRAQSARAKQRNATEPRVQPLRTPPAPKTRRSAQKSASNRNDEFAFLESNVSALDWGDAESFAEEFIASATGAEAVNEAARDEVIVEEMGGPFVDVPTETLPFGAVDWFGEEEPLG